MASDLEKMVRIQRELVNDNLLKEVEKMFEYNDDDVDVYIYPEDFKKIIEVGGRVYTIRENNQLVGCALVEFILFEKLNEREQIEDNTPVTVISALQIAEDKQGYGYGKQLADFIESENISPIILQTVWRTYRFWSDAMGYEPIEKDDDGDQTWMFKFKNVLKNDKIGVFKNW